MKSFLLVLGIMFTTIGTAGAADDTILAEVGDTKITMSDFKRILGSFGAEKQKALEEQPQYKVAILKRTVQALVVSKIAEQQGFDKRDDIRWRVNDLVATEYIKQIILGKINVTEDEIKSYYESHKGNFTKPFDNVREQVKEKVLSDLKGSRANEFIEKALQEAGAKMNLDLLLPKQK